MNDITYKVKSGEPVPLGTLEKGRKSVNFAIMAEGDEKCSLILYKRDTGKIATEIPFTDDMRFGNVYAMLVEGIAYSEYDYAYRIGTSIRQDPFARIINGCYEWGRADKEISSGIARNNYDWQGDRPLRHTFEDTIIYRMHVRGFTKSKYSKVRHKGTFKGIIEKIPYLKELGITMVELMPAYEFNEVIESNASKSEPRVKEWNRKNSPSRINYWGYCEGDYFTPKASYAASAMRGAAIKEFRDMVRELHKNDIEISMEFYFPESINPYIILECFRFWVREYHIDGIHCNVSDGIKDMIQKDPYLSRTKLIGYGWNNEKVYAMKHLAECNDVFMNTARCFLKGDEGRTVDMAFRLKYNPASAANINYLANNDTFSIMDMFSYSSKHNSENGEDNKDGREQNYSWNCGVEGNTRRKNVLQLRKRLVENSFMILLLSQGTPMIYAGDEFGNTCNGNNNPYCQDNETSWLDWRLIKKNNEIFEFVKSLISFRKQHPILHISKEMKCRDYHSLGMPDMSYHSEKTWVIDRSAFCRHFGVMLYGKYSCLDGKKEDNSIFIAFNMHWEEQSIGMPVNGKNKKWNIVFNTNSECDVEIKERMLLLPPRTAVVLISDECKKDDAVNKK